MRNNQSLFKMRPWSNTILPELAAFFGGDEQMVDRFARVFAGTRFVCPTLEDIKTLRAESEALDLVRGDTSPESQLAACRDLGLRLTRLRAIYLVDTGKNLDRREGGGDRIKAAVSMLVRFPRQSDDIAVLFNFRGAELRLFFAEIGRQPPPIKKKTVKPS